MAKRFIDTAIFNKGLVRGLEGAYKLLWIYLITNCDHAGIWDVFIEDAELKTGFKFKEEKALSVFGCKIIPIDGGKKWFIPSFIEFQYNGLELNPANKMHNSILKILSKYDLIIENKVQPSPLQGAMDKDKDMVMDKEMEKDKDKEQKKEKQNFQIEIRVIEYYNQATGRKASTKAMSNIKPITARLNEGLTYQDLCDIADFKVAEWTGTDMERHLVIDTLYGTKAEKYRTQVQNAKDKGLTASQIKGNGHRQDDRTHKDDLTERALRDYQKQVNEEKARKNERAN